MIELTRSWDAPPHCRSASLVTAAADNYAFGIVSGPDYLIVRLFVLVCPTALPAPKGLPVQPCLRATGSDLGEGVIRPPSIALNDHMASAVLSFTEGITEQGLPVSSSTCAANASFRAPSAILNAEEGTSRLSWTERPATPCERKETKALRITSLWWNCRSTAVIPGSPR
jgi:hypothetical protein